MSSFHMEVGILNQPHVALVWIGKERDIRKEQDLEND